LARAYETATPFNASRIEPEPVVIGSVQNKVLTGDSGLVFVVGLMDVWVAMAVLAVLYLLQYVED
jgi:hypothetical protein